MSQAPLRGQPTRMGVSPQRQPMQQHRVSPGVYRPGPAPAPIRPTPPPMASLGQPSMQNMWKPNPGQAFNGLGDALSKMQFNKWPQQIHSGPPLPNGIMAQTQQAAEQAMPPAPPPNQWQPGMPTHAPLARAIAKPAPTPGYAKAGFKSRTDFAKARADGSYVAPPPVDNRPGFAKAGFKSRSAYAKQRAYDKTGAQMVNQDAQNPQGGGQSRNDYYASQRSGGA